MLHESLGFAMIGSNPDLINALPIKIINDKVDVSDIHPHRMAVAGSMEPSHAAICLRRSVLRCCLGENIALMGRLHFPQESRDAHPKVRTHCSLADVNDALKNR